MCVTADATIDGMGEPDAFGYRQLLSHMPISRQVAEGKEPDTLQPVVCVTLRFPLTENLALDDEGKVSIVFSPDAADSLAAELTQWAARAREKHWE